MEGEATRQHLFPHGCCGPPPSIRFRQAGCGTLPQVLLQHRRLSSICASACYKVIIGRATLAFIVMCGKFPYSEDHCVLHIPHDRAMDHFVNYVHSSSVDGGEHYVQDAKYGIDNNILQLSLTLRQTYGFILGHLACKLGTANCTWRLTMSLLRCLVWQ